MAFTVCLVSCGMKPFSVSLSMEVSAFCRQSWSCTNKQLGPAPFKRTWLACWCSPLPLLTLQVLKPTHDAPTDGQESSLADRKLTMDAEIIRDQKYHQLNPDKIIDLRNDLKNSLSFDVFYYADRGD